MRTLPAEEAARLRSILLVRVVVSLVLQCLVLVVGVRTGRRVYRDRHLGVRWLLRVVAEGPLLPLAVLELVHWTVSTLWLARWVRRIRLTSSD